eukprot:COSAG01_NODE_50739_length_360_cov_53.505747_1_plen_45_part_01
MVNEAIDALFDAGLGQIRQFVHAHVRRGCNFGLANHKRGRIGGRI